MRYIPPLLKEHLQQNVTTTCVLLKIILVDGRTFGMTSLDRNVVYDGVEYSSSGGFDRSTIASNIGLSVDNAEAKVLFSFNIDGITPEMVGSGELDDAQWQMLLVNWNDLTMGHMTMDEGDVGMVTTDDNIVYMPELLSYIMRLRQTVGTLDSRTCRAEFGSPPNSQTGCGVDANQYWINGSVTGYGTERRLVFYDANLNLPYFPVPGRIKWTGGRNASRNRMYQIEQYSSGSIMLIEPVAFDIEIGDSFMIRKDCAKTLSACQSFNNVINMKGEHWIPVGDGVEASTPGAQTIGGVTSQAP